MIIEFFTIRKITQYSPSEPVKVYEKAISRKNNTLFDPKSILKKLTHDTTRDTIEKRKHNIVQQYIHVSIILFKKLFFGCYQVPRKNFTKVG